MAPQLRRYARKPDAIIRRSVSLAFTTPEECWTQSASHRQHFLRDLECDRNYHHDKRACIAFDNWVERVAGRTYRDTFFSYYKVVGRSTPQVSFYTQQIATNRTVLQQLASLAITKKHVDEINGIPPAYNTWAPEFTLTHDVFHSTNSRKQMKASIEACIKRRMWYRANCVLSCSKRFNTRSHDLFLLILQVLRAKLIMQFQD